MRVKVLCRNPDDYLRETKRDIQKGLLERFATRIKNPSGLGNRQNDKLFVNGQIICPFTNLTIYKRTNMCP